jgi:group II intron reverse transcriptase/maturase
MRTAETVLAILQDRGRRGLPLDDLYRQLFNPDVYLRGYGRLAQNQGAMTKGSTPETVDGMSMEKIDTIIEALRFERFRWTPVRRTYIPKANGKKRPLGVPTWTDKLVQEAIRTLLEAYYEPQFSRYSHGFRPGRGCHTALVEIRKKWTGTKWFIEGDIKGCFDNIDHDMLLKILETNIQDNRFLRLIKNMLQAGYLESWKYNATYSGTPQGGVVSPLLANIYLDRLDKFVEQELLPAYNFGQARENRAYKSLARRAGYARQKGRKDEAQALGKLQRMLPSTMTDNPDYRRLWYVRYADDFVLGFIGPRSEAEDIKTRIKDFLQDTLRLELSAEKTLITHATSHAARFLGYDIVNQQNDTKRTGLRRSANGRIALKMPMSIMRKKRKEYMKAGKPANRPELMNESDFTIVDRYHRELTGLAEYYKLAINRSNLWQLSSAMRHSLTATLANKHKTARSQIVERLTDTIETPDGPKKALVVKIEREDRLPLVARFGGYNFRRTPDEPIQDAMPQLRTGRTTLEGRLLATTCELCGATKRIQVHHIRKMADLKKPGQREKPAWVVRMAEIQRKTLVVCTDCHNRIHAGKPTRREAKGG